MTFKYSPRPTASDGAQQVYIDAHRPEIRPVEPPQPPFERDKGLSEVVLASKHVWAGGGKRHKWRVR